MPAQLRIIQTINRDVNHCARCGEDHENLVFKKFDKQPIIDFDGTVWEYWAECPIEHEPILMKVESH